MSQRDKLQKILDRNDHEFHKIHWNSGPKEQLTWHVKVSVTDYTINKILHASGAGSTKSEALDKACKKINQHYEYTRRNI